jgi:hypothetical protein
MQVYFKYRVRAVSMFFHSALFYIIRRQRRQLRRRLAGYTRIAKATS